MIKANELRIGNFVNYEGKPHEVISLSPKEIAIWPLRSGSATVVELADPIPLSPETLEKFGFEWETEKKKHLQLALPEQGLNRRYLSFFYDDGVCTMLQFYMEGYFDGCFEILPPKHLHTLQNLIHSLTSLELTYKP